jgi:hypothetical protein
MPQHGVDTTMTQVLGVDQTLSSVCGLLCAIVYTKGLGVLP